MYVEQGASAISGVAEAEDRDAAAAATAAGDADLGERMLRAEVRVDGTGHAAGGAHPATDPDAAANAAKVKAANPNARGQFGWHMWSQALVNGHWIDLDATLHIPYSIGHVLVGTSSMADKEAHNNHMQMAALIGNLDIVVREVRYDWEDKGSR